MNIEAVKNALISLAIRGKLVPQRDDEPAVEQIGEAPEEAPFEIPAKWKWCKLGEIADYGSTSQIMGTAVQSKDWLLDLEDIEKNTGRLIRKKRGASSKSNKNSFHAGNVLWGKLRPYLNKVLIADEDGFCTTEIVPISTRNDQYICKKYLKTCLMSPYFVDRATNLSYGVKMPRMGTKDATNSPIPLPPLAEQRRIVAKLEELLEPLSRVQERLGNLTHDFPEQFKAAVLQKAIQGKLVPQLDSEPAVEQIGEAPKEVPFEIPRKWRWCRLGAVIELTSGRDLTSSEIMESKSPEAVPYITGASQINDGELLVNRWTTSGIVFSQVDDLLLTCKGTVGKMAFNQLGQMHIARQLMAIRTSVDQVDIHYVAVFLKASLQILINAARSMIPGINRKDVLNLKFPLPPLSEQRRIVAKVEQLFSQVDELTARLSS